MFTVWEAQLYVCFIAALWFRVVLWRLREGKALPGPLWGNDTAQTQALYLQVHALGPLCHLSCLPLSAPTDHPELPHSKGSRWMTGSLQVSGGKGFFPLPVWTADPHAARPWLEFCWLTALRVKCPVEDLACLQEVLILFLLVSLPAFWAIALITLVHFKRC